MFGPGNRNLITDVAGLAVGHATDEQAGSGATVLVCKPGWNASVDVRGGGPGTRETEALAPENLVGMAHAIVLAGGSVFGLAAADGVTAELSTQNIGLHLRPGTPAIPIVPAAVLHDLSNSGNKHWGHSPPYRDLGIQALHAAGAEFALGAVGAGRGAMAGLIKGGIGSVSIDLGAGLIVGALVALNSVGSALMPDGRTYWAWPMELNSEFGGQGPPAGALDLSDPLPDESRLHAIGRMQPGANTTLGVVACSAALSGAECKRVAMMAQDGIARAVRPAHTPFDGDTIFALASGQLVMDQTTMRAAHIARIGAAAADCMARAIGRAVYSKSTPVSIQYGTILFLRSDRTSRPRCAGCVSRPRVCDAKASTFDSAVKPSDYSKFPDLRRSSNGKLVVSPKMPSGISVCASSLSLEQRQARRRKAPFKQKRSGLSQVAPGWVITVRTDSLAPCPP